MPHSFMRGKSKEQMDFVLCMLHKTFCISNIYWSSWWSFTDIFLPTLWLRKIRPYTANIRRLTTWNALWPTCKHQGLYSLQQEWVASLSHQAFYAHYSCLSLRSSSQSYSCSLLLLQHARQVLSHEIAFANLSASAELPPATLHGWFFSFCL